MSILKNHEQSFKKRTGFLFVVFCFGALGILSRVFYLQFCINDKLEKYSESQFIRKTKIFSNRGRILDRNGKALAINVRKHNLFTMPKELSNSKKEFKKLKKILPKLSLKKVLNKLKTRDKFTWIGRNLELTDKQVKEIEGIKGIYTEPIITRFYPNGELLSQTLGFIGIDNKGLSGIEYQFNDILKGKETEVSYVRDAKGRSIKFETLTEKNNSQSISLSIDKDIQADAEKFLKEAVRKHNADLGGIGVMDASSGEILAMANYPTFDLNNRNKYSSKSKRLSFISSPFEPGSVLKSLTIAGALETGKVSSDSLYYCEDGRYKVGKHFINESAGHKYKWLSVKDILKYSSNIGTTKIAFDLGYPSLLKTFEQFGLGAKTNLELPSESRGIFSKEKKVRKIRLSNLSFGQGIAVTGVQLLASYAPFANGGFFVQPTLIKKESSSEKLQIISSEHIEPITRMLESVVESGTGDKAKIKNHRIAGKTGTAQRPSQDGGYDGYLSSFVGYPVNVKNPFVVVVYIDNPKKNGYYGNEVASPVFKKITESILIRRNEFGSFNSRSLARKANKTNNDSLKISRSAIRKTAKKGETPELLGLDKSSLLKFAEENKIKIKIQGFGIVYKQKPKAFMKLPKDRTLKVFLRPPTYDQ